MTFARANPLKKNLASRSLSLARSALDYEWWTSNSYPNPFRFIVECTVLADKSVHDIDFQLDLIDVNDNPPIFTQSIYHINLTETTPINAILSTAISAYDSDSGASGTFSYSLQNTLSSYAVSQLASACVVTGPAGFLGVLSPGQFKQC